MADLENTGVIVDHQGHWYPRWCVQALIGRSAYPTAERSADGGMSCCWTTASASPRWAG